MPRYRKPKKPALQCRFDYDAFRKRLKAAGGIHKVCRAAGVSPGSYHYVRNTQTLPLSRPIRRLMEYLNFSCTDVRELFVPKKRKKP